ncbi:MAG TPA: DUF2975 domain-containing protein [Vicinamibacterales bacterium]|nr:DUF2975 domain-containing protein [Vicinamibacterales bacterium]
MRKASIASVLVVVLNVAWWLVALAMVLATGLAGMSAFHEVGNAQIDIPVSFSVDPQALPVNAPTLGIERAQIEHARGSLKFPPPPGTSFIAPALFGLALMLAAVLFVVGQLRAVIRTLRDGRPFVRANAARIRWIAFAVIAGEIAKTVIVYSANAQAMTHFSASGLRFDARPDFNVVTIVHGLIILAIAEVFRAGTRLDEEQSLTI